MQKEAAEKRIQHEMEMLQIQQDFEDKKRKAEQKSKVADKLVKWEDQDQPHDNLIRFEDTMRQAGIPEEQWPHRLRPLLSGRALVAYSRDVSYEAKMSYQDLKDALLDSLGMLVKQCGERIWSFQRTGSDSHHDTAWKLEFVMQRAAHGCGSVQEVVTKLTMAKFLTLYPLTCGQLRATQQPSFSGRCSQPCPGILPTTAEPRSRTILLFTALDEEI